MTVLSGFNSYGEELERQLKLRTSPIAIKLLQKEADIPEKAIRPKRDWGLHLALCQAFAKSRREGAMIAMLKEDHWCYIPVIAFGLAKPPESFLEGSTDFPERIADLAAARNLAKAFPRLNFGKYAGLVSAPLKTANFQPDLVVIYCNSAQLRYLLAAIKYKEGCLVTSRLDPSAACVQCTVPVLQSGECQVTVPCGGDRKRALAQDDEMIFSVPGGKLEDLILGLRHFDDVGQGYGTFAPDMRLEYPLPDIYLKVARMMGMEVHE